MFKGAGTVAVATRRGPPGLADRYLFVYRTLGVCCFYCELELATSTLAKEFHHIIYIYQ